MIWGTTIGAIKGDTTSLDYSSFDSLVLVVCIFSGQAGAAVRASIFGTASVHGGGGSQP